MEKIFKNDLEFKNFLEELTRLLIDFIENQNNILRIGDQIETSFKGNSDISRKFISNLIFKKSYISEKSLSNSKEEIDFILSDRISAFNGNKELQENDSNRSMLEGHIDSLIQKNPDTWFEIISNINSFAASHKDKNTPSRVKASLLTLLATDFEVLIINSLRASIELKVNTIFDKMSKNTNFSIQPHLIKQYQTTEELIKNMVINKFDGNIRGGYKEWINILSNDLGVNNCRLEHLPGLEEVLEARHLIVHTAGQNIDNYRKNYEDSIYKAPICKDQIEINQEYLSQAADILACSAITIIFRIITEYNGKNNARKNMIEESIANLTYRLLQDNRYLLTKRYIQELPLDKFQSLDCANILKVNRWIAMRELNEKDNLKEELSSWDTESLHSKYLMAKYALLEEHEKAIEVARSMPLILGKNFIFHWHEWPLLHQTRAYSYRNDIKVFPIQRENRKNKVNSTIRRTRRTIKKISQKNRPRHIPKTLNIRNK